MQNKEVTLTQEEFDAIEGCSTAFQKGFFMVTCGKLYGDGFNICDSCVKKAIKAKKKKPNVRPPCPVALICICERGDFQLGTFGLAAPPWKR